MLLYYITDRRQFPGDETTRRRALLAKLAEAARSGIDYIQLREKDLSPRDLEALAREAVRAIQDSALAENQELRTRLFINSRTDVALAVGAGGVHLRSEDVSATEVRRIVSAFAAGISKKGGILEPSAARFLVAASCHSPADVQRAAEEGGDFAVFAPVFEKLGVVRPSGLAALHEACRAKIPVLALGGVTLENAAECLRAGAAGIAGIRVFQQNPLAPVVRRLRELANPRR